MWSVSRRQTQEVAYEPMIRTTTILVKRGFGCFEDSRDDDDNHSKSRSNMSKLTSFRSPSYLNVLVDYWCRVQTNTNSPTISHQARNEIYSYHFHQLPANISSESPFYSRYHLDGVLDPTLIQQASPSSLKAAHCNQSLIALLETDESTGAVENPS